MSLEIVIERQTGERRTEWLPDFAPLSVGRQPSCAVWVDDSHISRRHAILHPEPSGIRVEDTSRNGTLAGDTLLVHRSASVPYGTPIFVGKHVLYVWARPGRDAADRTPCPPSSGAGQARVEETCPDRADLQHDRPKTETRAEGPSFEAEAVLRREIHRRLLAHLDLTAMQAGETQDPSLRPRVVSALRQIVAAMEAELSPGLDRDRLVGDLADEALGLGPLEHLLSDPSVSEIMVVAPNTLYVERHGTITRATQRFTDDRQVRAVIERIVTPIGRRIDEASPLVDARLADGCRVNAIIAPLALRGSCLTIRKFAAEPFTLQRLVDEGTLDPRMGRFLTRSVVARKSIVVSGGTGSGKTTLLNVLSAAIPGNERIVTIEDAAELRLAQSHVVSLETRPSNLEGQGNFTVRDLVKNALRMRPDRIVVGECRGAEALDMLQAMNTGHDGSLTTLHASSAREALARIETMAMMASLELPSRALREQIAASVKLVVQIARFSDGSRKVSDIAEVCGLDRQGTLRLRSIYRFVQTGIGPDGKVQGHFAATGYLPTFLGEFLVRGLVVPGEAYL